MRFPGIRKALARWVAKALTFSGVDSGRGWISLWNSSDTHTGSWQQDVRMSNDEILGFAPVYACTTLISSDVGKVCLRLMKLEGNIWQESTNPAYTPVLRKPNHFQTRQQFVESWVLSKLLSGNTYVLKQRDARKVVTALYILDPSRVTPLVATETGAVFYEIRRDDLSKVPMDIPAIPASEIIHDRMECLFHPLVGISPLFASALASSQGTKIQKNSEVFFRNMSRPGGMLTAPTTIDDETAKRLKTEFEKNFSGDKIGRLFVGGDGLKFEATAFHAEQAQLVEQLKLSAEQVAMAFHVPAYMIGATQPPATSNVPAMTQEYYQRCLQKLYTAIEDLLDDGLGILGTEYRTEFDLEELMRMDAAAQTEMLVKASGGAYMKPNEARAKVGYKPVPGGDALYKQHQDYSLEALAKRDAKEDPFDTGKETPTTAPSANDEEVERAKVSAREFMEKAQAEAQARVIAEARAKEAETKARTVEEEFQAACEMFIEELNAPA